MWKVSHGGARLGKDKPESRDEFVKKQTLAEESLGWAGGRRWWRTVSKRRAAEASLGGVEAARAGHGWLTRGGGQT